MFVDSSVSARFFLHSESVDLDLQNEAIHTQIRPFLSLHSTLPGKAANEAKVTRPSKMTQYVSPARIFTKNVSGTGVACSTPPPPSRTLLSFSCCRIITSLYVDDCHPWDTCWTETRSEKPSNILPFDSDTRGTKCQGALCPHTPAGNSI